MHSERGRRRERDHFSVNDPVVNPRSSQAQTLIDPRRVFDTILSEQPQFAGSRQGGRCRSDGKNTRALSSMTSADAEFARNVCILLVLGFRREALTACKRGARNIGHAVVRIKG